MTADASSWGVVAGIIPWNYPIVLTSWFMFPALLSGNTILIKTASQKQFHPLVESWTHAEPLGEAITPITLKKNQYFMMGDNHPDSCDSRTWGTVPRSDIIGKAFVRIWPLSRIGFL